MRRPTRLPSSTATSLDSLIAAIQREAEGAEADPFDEAMVAAVAGAAEAMRAEASDLDALHRRLLKLSRQRPA